MVPFHPFGKRDLDRGVSPSRSETIGSEEWRLSMCWRPVDVSGSSLRCVCVTSSPLCFSRSARKFSLSSRDSAAISGSTYFSLNVGCSAMIPSFPSGPTPRKSHLGHDLVIYRKPLLDRRNLDFHMKGFDERYMIRPDERKPTKFSHNRRNRPTLQLSQTPNNQTRNFRPIQAMDIYRLMDLVNQDLIVNPPIATANLNSLLGLIIRDGVL